MKLTIAGSEFNKDLINHVKSALTETFSSVKKDSIVKAFLTRMVGANNEHELKSHFQSDIEVGGFSGGTLTIITLKEYYLNDIVGEWTRICGSDEAVERSERELFTEVFDRFNHNSRQTADYITSHFDGLIETIYEPKGIDINSDDEWEISEQKKDDFIESFHKLSSSEMIEWLFANADTNELMIDFIGSVCDGQFDVTYNYERIIM